MQKHMCISFGDKTEVHRVAGSGGGAMEVTEVEMWGMRAFRLQACREREGVCSPTTAERCSLMHVQVE